MLRRFGVIMFVAFLLTGCRGQAATTVPGTPVPQSKEPSNDASSSHKPSFKAWTDERFGYQLAYPEGWTVGGAGTGEQVYIAPSGTGLDPEYPSIRLFIQNRDESRNINIKPILKEQMVGRGNWPYMTVKSVTDTQVDTVVGTRPAYLLSGEGAAKEVQYEGVGLYVYGEGHSYQFFCTSPKSEWATWESVCQEVIRTFKGGDMSKSHLAK